MGEFYSFPSITNPKSKPFTVAKCCNDNKGYCVKFQVYKNKATGDMKLR